MLLFVAACSPSVYSRTGAGLVDNDGGSDTTGEADAGMPGSGGGGTGGSFGTGGGGAGAFGPGGAVGSGGKGVGGTSGTGGAATGGANTGGAAAGGRGGTGGAATGGRSAGTGGAATGGRSAGTGGAATGGMATGGAGTGGAGTGGAVGADTAQYNFEASSQAWSMAAGGGAFTTVARSTVEHFAGLASLAGSVTAAAAGVTYILEVAPPTPVIPPGAVVTYHVFVPSAAALGAIQPYVLETGTFRFTGTRTLAANIARGGWTTVKVNVPANAAAILRMGVQFESTGVWTDTVYVDSITW